MPKQKLLIIVGPTASGKSGLAVELARKFNGEVTSADSRQVYKGLNIGTGKIKKSEMKRIPHHLLDIASPKKMFSAQDFVTRANRSIVQIIGAGKLPIVAGGTGFYIDALTGRIAIPHIEPNQKLRARLEKKSAEELYGLLKEKDPDRAAKMATPSERNNKRRLIRALEIASSGTKGPSLGNSAFDALWIGIRPSLAELEKKIEIRLKARLKAGMIAEAKKLHGQGLSYKRMKQLGLEYRSLARLLQKEISRKELEEELIRDIRRYAKHQIIYWKRNQDIRWFKQSEIQKIEKTVRVWLDN